MLQVAAGALVCGVLAELLLPGADGWKAVVFAGVPFAFEAAGDWCGRLIDRWRLMRERRRQSGRTIEVDRPAGPRA